MRNTIISTALATIVLAAASQPALAQPAPGEVESFTVTVETADLDLRSSQGMATLQGRIAGAVEAVCPQADIRDLREGMDMRECRRLAHADAQEQVAALRTGTVRVIAVRDVRSSEG